MSIIKVKSRGTDNVAGRRNLMINGAMQIAQRGTSSTNSGYGTCDRWKHTYSTDQYAATQAQVTDVPTGYGFTKSLRYTVTTPETSLDGTNYVAMTQFIEAQNLNHLCYGTSSAKTSTLSFWVKSSVTGTYAVSIFQNDASRNFVPTYAISSANTWEHKTIEIPGDTGGTIDDNADVGFSMYWLLGAGATYTAGSGNNSTWGAYSTGNFAKGHTTDWAENNGATFLLTGVQLEVGDSASDFEFRSYPEELALCKRYFERIDSLSTSSSIIGVGFQYNNDPQSIYESKFTEKRATPSLAVSNVSHLQRIRAGTSGVNSNITGLSFNGTNKIGTLHDISSQTNNLGDGCYLRFQNTSGTLDYDAEL